MAFKRCECSSHPCICRPEEWGARTGPTDEENAPCVKCGRKDLPLHTNYQCAECWPPVKYDAWELSKVAEYHNADQNGTYCERVDDNEDRTTDYGFIRYLWTIYGHIPGEGAEAIGDFETEEHAMSVYLRLPDLKEKR